MINIEEVKAQYPDLAGFDRSVLREYLQYKILNTIFKSKQSGKLSFLGCTAIKICYGSSRFSEDLDFDNFSLSKKEFKLIMAEVKKDLAYEGLEAKISLVFKGAYRAYIKIPKILF